MSAGAGFLTITTESDGATRDIGRRLAALVRPGDVVELVGPMGAGKTVFVTGLAEGLGVEERVTSPTFIIMRSYRSGFLPLVHVDAYRLGSFGEFDDLGVFDEAAEGVLIIEWGDIVAAGLPEDRLTIRFQRLAESTRTISVEPAGSWVDRPLREVVA